MRYLIYLFCLLGLSSLAQTYSVSGTVKNKLNNEILVGATVGIDSTQYAFTDINGNFHFMVDSGDHLLSVGYGDFSEYKNKISVQNDTNLVVLLTQLETTDVVVISAGRFEQKLADVTVSVDVIKPEIIANNNTTSLEKAVEQVPGVTIINGQANIRGGGGFSYGAGSRVLLLIDDVPVIRAGAGDVLWDYLPTENIAQIEVVKGASSALYGASAMNGVINVRTALAGDKPQTSVRLFSGVYDDPNGETYDWYDNQNPHPNYLGYSFGHMRRVGNHDIGFSGNGLEDQGFKEDGQLRKARLSLTTRFRPAFAQGLTLGINANAQYTDMAQFLLWNDDTTGFFQPLEGRAGRLTWRQYSVDPHVTYRKGNSKYTYRGKLFLVNQAGLYYNELQYQQTIQLPYNISWVLTPGYVSNYMDVSVEEFGDHVSNQNSFYLQNDFDFGALKISMGARHEIYVLDAQEKNEGTVYRAGLNYRLPYRTNVRLSYGQGYRNPSMAEKFIRFSAPPLEIYPNADLIPENAETAEIGIKHQLKLGKFTAYFDAAYFWAQYDQMMEFAFDRWGTLDDSFWGLGFKSINRPLVKITGTEFSTNGVGKIGPVDMSFLMGYTFISPIDLSVDQTDSTFEAGDEILKYRIEHTFKGNLQLNYKKFTTGVNMRYYSFMKNIDPVFEIEELVPGLNRYREENAEADYVWDLNLGYKISNQSTVSFIVKNAWNNIFTIRPAFPEPPRTFVVQVHFKV